MVRPDAVPGTATTDDSDVAPRQAGVNLLGAGAQPATRAGRRFDGTMKSMLVHAEMMLERERSLDGEDGGWKLQSELYVQIEIQGFWPAQRA